MEQFLLRCSELDSQAWVTRVEKLLVLLLQSVPELKEITPPTTWVSIRALQVQESLDTRGSRALRSRGTAVRARSLEPEGWGGLPEESRTQQDPVSPGCWAGSGDGRRCRCCNHFLHLSQWAIAGTGNRCNFNAGDIGWCGMCPIPGDVNEACGHDRREDTADSSGL